MIIVCRRVRHVVIDYVTKATRRAWHVFPARVVNTFISDNVRRNVINLTEIDIIPLSMIIIMIWYEPYHYCRLNWNNARIRISLIDKFVKKSYIFQMCKYLTVEMTLKLLIPLYLTTHEKNTLLLLKKTDIIVYQLNARCNRIP